MMIPSWTSGLCRLLTTAAMVACLPSISAQVQTPEIGNLARIDAAVEAVLRESGVPSASVGVVQGGKVVYIKAFGNAKLVPETRATAAMAYPVGSISKQFTAACVLLLQQDGKLTLDDPVSRWFPELTRAREVTVRELLSHTSGYEDYAPQDYTIPAWTRPTEPRRIVEEWAGKPLDFDPGTQWQYSNTNFVLAALIVEKAAGMPFFDFLSTRILHPLGLTGALNLDTQRDRLQTAGYERHALGPLRPAMLEAPGWYFGDASLAMPVADLLKWDISIMDQTLLKPESYVQFETAVPLKTGKSTNYGLGIQVLSQGGHRILEHSGEVGGYVAENLIFPDDKIAVAVLTNQEASSAAGEIASSVAKLLMGSAPAHKEAEETAEEKQIQAILNGLEQHTIDRALFTADANFYYSEETIGDFASSLAPLGRVTGVVKKSESLRGGMVEGSLEATLATGTHLSVSTYRMKDGRLEQLLVEAQR